jgi:anti-sigma regulatory factor (Ser/Thr protein kinase)
MGVEHRLAIRMSRSLEIRISNVIAELAKVRDAFDNLSAELRVQAETSIPLQVALDEIAGNAIRYSWPDGAHGEVVVRITVRPEDVTLDIFDDGLAFDPRDAPEPADRRSGPGGIGIHMVRQLVDGFTWRRVDGLNHTTLTKKRVADTAPKQE